MAPLFLFQPNVLETLGGVSPYSPGSRFHSSSLWIPASLLAQAGRGSGKTAAAGFVESLENCARQEGTESGRCLGSTVRSSPNRLGEAWSLRVLAPGLEGLPARHWGLSPMELPRAVSGGIWGLPGTALCRLRCDGTQDHLFRSLSRSEASLFLALRLPWGGLLRSFFMKLMMHWTATHHTEKQIQAYYL